jgi:phosphohistidine phosphatase SixA
MVIGHNPGWEDAVYDLTGVHATMTTCNAALLTVDATSWAEAAESSEWELVNLLRPKEL